MTHLPHLQSVICPVQYKTRCSELFGSTACCLTCSCNVDARDYSGGGPDFGEGIPNECGGINPEGLTVHADSDLISATGGIEATGPLIRGMYAQV